MSRNTVSAVTLTSLDTATFTGSYQVVNTAGLPQPCFLVRIINNSNRDITVSYNGTTDHDFIPTLTRLELSLQVNAQPNNNVAKLSQGTKIYVKGTAGGTGLVYMSGYYQIKE